MDPQMINTMKQMSPVIDIIYNFITQNQLSE